MLYSLGTKPSSTKTSNPEPETSSLKVLASQRAIKSNGHTHTLENRILALLNTSLNFKFARCASLAATLLTETQPMRPPTKYYKFAFEYSPKCTSKNVVKRALKNLLKPLPNRPPKPRPSPFASTSKSMSKFQDFQKSRNQNGSNFWNQKR